ncbi:MAG: sigma factor [Isosphaeraceae bacterium]
MASDPDRTALRQIDRLFRGGSVTGLDDGQLLDRFAADRDELALEALIAWHGPMVLGVCRRWLANPHDVEDAFQATFLILVRKARSLRDVHRLGPWLHGVAYRVAVRARADAARRRVIESGQLIGGHIRDENRRPVKDAEVIVAFAQNGHGPDQDVPGSLKSGAEGIFASFQTEQVLSGFFPSIRVKTDAEGRWRCSCLPAHPNPATRLFFQVRHPDYLSDTEALFRRTLSLKTARAMTGALVLKSGVSVGGQVLDANGAAVPGARIALAYSNGESDFLATRTDVAGRFAFAHVDDDTLLGRCVISVEAHGMAPDRNGDRASCPDATGGFPTLSRPTISRPGR